MKGLDGMQPIIGITASIKDNKKTTINNDNYQAITQSLGIPVILPNLLKEDEIEGLANTIDGLLLTGGGDIDPTLFGEEPHINLGGITPNRDVFEMALIKRMLDMNKPIMAICRGCQILNIAAGGDMYQDIYTQEKRELLQHVQNAPRSYGSHFVNVREGSLLHQTVQKATFKVNSFHHQAVRKMGKGFQVSATSSDGIIEAIESTQHKFVVGLQWHPECMITHGDPQAKALFDEFIKAVLE